MQNAPAKTLFDTITDFLATNPAPDEIINYELPEHLQIRAHGLLEKNGEGELTPREYEEMMDFVRIDQMMSLLKVKMRLKLKEADK